MFIVSEKGGEYRVKNPFKGKRVVLLDVDENKEKLIEGEILVFETRPGACYLLYAEGEKPQPGDLNIPVPSRKPSETNWFGVKLHRKLFYEL